MLLGVAETIKIGRSIMTEQREGKAREREGRPSTYTF
jgi:hypothetical protein